MNRPRTLNLNWRMAVFSSVSLVAFVGLGIWQLERATEKVTLLAGYEARLQQPPLTSTALLQRQDAVDDLPLRLYGRYEPEPALLKDNVVLEGKVGFEVLQVFIDDATGQRFLIDRGFVPMAETRQIRPKIPPVSLSQVSLLGRVYVSKSNDERLNGRELIDDLRIVQSTDPKMLQPVFHETLFPHLIRLDAADPFALPRHWVLTTISPDKHRGYAAQWFLMALAVLIAFSYFTLRSVPSEEAN